MQQPVVAYVFMRRIVPGKAAALLAGTGIAGDEFL